MLILQEPFSLDLQCVQGDSFQESFTVQDDSVNVNFTGFTGALVARMSAAGDVVFSITTSSGITLGNGSMAIAIDDAVTLAYRPGVYSYQLRVSDATDTQTWFEGNFTIKERRQ